MSLSHSIYLALPRSLQNFALDIKGRQERKTRFAGHYHEQRLAAAHRRQVDRATLATLSLDRLNETIEIARRGTRFYPEYWGDSTPPRIDKLDEIAEFPILHKDQLRKLNDLFRCTLVPTPITLQTTGTTGTPVRIFCNPSARQANYAFFDDFLASRQIDPRSRRIVFGGRVVVSGHGQHGPYWRYSKSLDTFFFSSYHIGPKTLHEYVSGIRHAQPDFIEAYPSAVSHLAQLLSESGLELGLTVPVVTSSETIESTQRELIGSAFGAGVYDQYGAAEMCVFAEMCDAGRYHVRQDYSYVEVLNEQGQHAGPGEVGQVVCTSFLNPGMPLVRYAIGDLVQVAPEGPCSCGWDTPTWTAILGRKDDVIWTRSGRAIGRLSPVLKGFPIVKARYIQDDIDALRVLVVPGQGFSLKTIDAIRRAVELRVGGELAVVVEPVEALPTCPGGKHRSVVVSVRRPNPGLSLPSGPRTS